jgi:hypothetical protein
MKTTPGLLLGLLAALPLATPSSAQDCAAVSAKLRELENRKAVLETILAETEDQLRRTHDEARRCPGVSDVDRAPGSRPPRTPEPAAPTPVPSGVWALKGIRVFPKQSGTKILGSLGAAGGTLEVDAPGEPYQFCPGGRERSKMTIAFTPTLTTLRPGTRITAQIKAEPGLMTRPCTGAIAARTGISLATHGVSPFSKEESVGMADLFRWVSGAGRAYAENTGQTSSAEITFADGMTPTGKDAYASFLVTISTPDGTTVHAYLFEHAGVPMDERIRVDY